MSDRKQENGPKKPLKTNDALTPKPPSKAPPNMSLAPKGSIGTNVTQQPVVLGPRSCVAQQRVAEKEARDRDKAALRGMVGRDRDGRGPTILKKDFDRVR
jgi:hypothetical protein